MQVIDNIEDILRENCPQQHGIGNDPQDRKSLQQLLESITPNPEMRTPGLPTPGHDHELWTQGAGQDYCEKHGN